jgi:hypothetical protein
MELNPHCSKNDIATNKKREPRIVLMTRMGNRTSFVIHYFCKKRGIIIDRFFFYRKL